MQLELLMQGTACRRAFIWGRSADKVRSFAQEMTKKGFFVSIANTPKELALKSQLIVTTTASHEPILQASDIQPGTHITAMGADAPGKQELDPHIMGLADVVVVDDKAQCIDHGEICTAVRQGLITEQSLIELGDILLTPSKGRQNDEQITVADLTGVAVQDIQIVKAILSAS
jgi:ornithine cyclodeaminase